MKPFDVYPLRQFEPVKGKGAYLWDKEGNKYLDFYGGHAVISIGHSHPHYVDAITKQLNQLGFYSNSVLNTIQEQLAEKLGIISGYPDYNLFLCNSGAEANENALKLASFTTGKSKIICVSGSFHGRTSAAVAATDDETLRAPVNVSDKFIFVEFNNLVQLEQAFTNENIAGLIIEGIQGVAGIFEPLVSFLQKAEELCRNHNAIFILDEIQSGYGRTGKFFAHQYAGVKPHIITIAKGMGNGFPVAGVLIHPSIEAKHKMLGATFGGNYLACAASLAVLEIIEQEELMNNAKIIGEELKKLLQQCSLVKSVRGKGLMLGVELYQPAKTVANALFKQNNVLAGFSNCPNTLRLLPPLTISGTKVEWLMKGLSAVAENVANTGSA